MTTAPPLDRSAGRSAFGRGAAGYDAARPAYPGWVFDVLRERCGLGPGAMVLEIGAGTGTATRGLLDAGPLRLLAVEPDRRMAQVLVRGAATPALEVVVSSFEAAELATGAFDLAVCATAFHWLEEDAALAKIAATLRPGGWWAAIWNIFGDDSRPDPFHEATQALLDGPVGPSAGTGGTPFGLDQTARLAALARSGRFEPGAFMTATWDLVLDADAVAALYATFSNVELRPDRQAVLAELRRIARDAFGGRVVRHMTTSLCLARRRG